MVSRRGQLTIIVVCLMLLVSGCASGDETQSPSSAATTTSGPTKAGTTTDGITPEGGQTTTAVTQPTTTPLPDWAEPASNPWGRSPIVVAVVDDVGARDDYVDQVERAISYWETDGANFTRWEPAFVLRPDAEDPDVIVRFVDGVWGCGSTSGDEIVGCASVLDSDDEPNDPEVIEIDGNLSEYRLYSTTRHEFGHLLGLRHDDEPQAVMAQSSAVPVDLDASGVIGVHVEIKDSITAKSGTREQVDYALDYYEGGAGGWLERNVTFVEVDDPGDADVRLVFFDGDLDGSEGFVSEGIIRVDTWDPTTRGWHVGYWLGFFFGAESKEDLPEPFNEPRTDDRREWW